LKLCITSDGYHQVHICENGKRKHYLVHRLVLTLFKGDCPDGYECDHIDRNKLNNCIDNLHWVTHYENCMNRSDTRNDILETDPKKRQTIFVKEYYKKNYIKKERKHGYICIRNNKYRAIITVNKVTYTKTFATRDEAQNFIDSKTPR
jgi:hypothetical protein